MPRKATLGHPGWASPAVRKRNKKARESFNARHREYRKIHRERYRLYLEKWNRSKRGKELKKIWHLKRYGVTLEQWNSMWAKQKGKCPICETTKPKKVRGRKNGWHLDHDHKTGRFRGILCLMCNIGIGYFNDDPKKLKKAISYLRKKVT